MHQLPLLIMLSVTATAYSAAQAAATPCVETMPGMQMCPHPLTSETAAPGAPIRSGTMFGLHPQDFVHAVEDHSSSGTSAEPNSTPHPMLMAVANRWMVMFHANVFVTDLQQTGARGGDKFFSTNWFMPMAQRRFGPGLLTLRAMLSLEPATISGRRYPLLFQQGETAFGLPIVDGQHPHNFFMELAALYDLPVGERTVLSLYVAPMGDPALGPTAYPHRASAAEDPVAPLGHHQEDSTHISDDVVTAGLTHGMVRIEASGFHGREPDEHRWRLASGAIDSWSTRLTLQPGMNWSGQYSYGRISSPEALFPAEDQARTTASVMYNRAWATGNWASSAVWGRTRAIPDGSKEDSYLFESLLRFRSKNDAWTRFENADRSNELLVGEARLPPGFAERPIGHVQAYSFGYDRDERISRHLRTALGVQMTTYGVPGVLRPVYGPRPLGAAVFLRLRPGPRTDLWPPKTMDVATPN